MRKILLSAAILLFGGGALMADSATTRFGLTKPDIGSTNWGPKLNTNSDLIDNAAGQSLANTFTSSQTFQVGVEIDGQCLESSGTAALPAYSYRQFSTTGWYAAAGPSLHASIAGTGIVSVLSTGLFPDANLTSQLGGTGNKWTDTYSSNFHAGYGTTNAPSYSIGLSSNGFYADSDITFKAIVQKGYAAGGGEFTFGTGGLQIQADGALNPLAVSGINNNDMGILIKNNSTGTSAVSVLSAQEANNQDAVSLAVFGENYGIPGGHRLGVLPPNNITVLESGGTASNGMVIDTILNQPIWFGVNSTLVLTLATGTYAATFAGSVSGSSASFTGGLNTSTAVLSGVLTLPAGAVGAPSLNVSNAATGFYKSGTNEIGVALNGVHAADFFTTGTGDNVTYYPMELYAGGGSNTAFEFITQSTTGVTSAGRDILFMDINAYDCLVAGADGGGNDFNDRVLVGYYNSGGSPSVTSYTTRGSPAARTYAHDGDGSMKLTMGSGTYTIRVACHGMTTR